MDKNECIRKSIEIGFSTVYGALAGLKEDYESYEQKMKLPEEQVSTLESKSGSQGSYVVTSSMQDIRNIMALAQAMKVAIAANYQLGIDRCEIMLIEAKEAAAKFKDLSIDQLVMRHEQRLNELKQEPFTQKMNSLVATASDDLREMQKKVDEKGAEVLCGYFDEMIHSLETLRGYVPQGRAYCQESKEAFKIVYDDAIRAINRFNSDHTTARLQKEFVPIEELARQNEAMGELTAQTAEKAYEVIYSAAALGFCASIEQLGDAGDMMPKIGQTIERTQRRLEELRPA